MYGAKDRLLPFIALMMLLVDLLGGLLSVVGSALGI